METGIINRNDGAWQGHPDVAFFNGKLFVVYRQSDQHKTASETKIQLTWSNDTKTFFDPITIASSLDRYNCPRLSVIGDALYVLCDRIRASNDYVGAEDNPNLTSVLLWRSTDGENWDGPTDLGITGIVPDRILSKSGQFFIATHTKEPSAIQEESELDETQEKMFLPYKNNGNLIQNVWIANDLEGPWTQHLVAKRSGLNLCEGSIFYVNRRYVCVMRENSALGQPAYYCTSKNGKEWSDVSATRMAGCHRPVCGVLRSGRILTTYREAIHTFERGYWAKNTFACLTHESSVTQHRNFYKSIILPLDHDNSHRSDSGYTGWVQLPDDSIFIVNYITGNAPKPYIKWYRIDESEF